jgi:hypothetical protein
MRDHRLMTGADQLHEALVQEIRAAGGARRGQVHRALRAVPRHLFVPEVPLEEAYAVGSVGERGAGGVTYPR